MSNYFKEIITRPESSIVLLNIIQYYVYLILVGGINTVNFVIALVSVYTIEKARNGAIAVVMEIISEIDLSRLVFFSAIVLIVGGIATILALPMSLTLWRPCSGYWTTRTNTTFVS